MTVDATLDATVRQAFERVLDPRDVLSDPVQCRSYECDGLTGYRVRPALVLLPRDAAQVAAAVRVCHEHGVPFVARGAGTSRAAPGGRAARADAIARRRDADGGRGGCGGRSRCCVTSAGSAMPSCI